MSLRYAWQFRDRTLQTRPHVRVVKTGILRGLSKLKAMIELLGFTAPSLFRFVFRFIPGHRFTINFCCPIRFFFHEHFEHRATQFGPVNQRAVESVRCYEGSFELKLIEKNLRLINTRQSQFAWLVQHVKDNRWRETSQHQTRMRHFLEYRIVQVAQYARE